LVIEGVLRFCAFYPKRLTDLVSFHRPAGWLARRMRKKMRIVKRAHTHTHTQRVLNTTLHVFMRAPTGFCSSINWFARQMLKKRTHTRARACGAFGQGTTQLIEAAAKHLARQSSKNEPVDEQMAFKRVRSEEISASNSLYIFCRCELMTNV